MALPAPAWGAEVVSSNIVGYTKVSLEAGHNLIGSQFLLVGGQTPNINELTTSLDGQSGYDDSTYSPTTELRVWTGNGYDTYGWTGDLLKDSPELAGEMGVTDDSIDNQWLDMDYAVTEDPLANGQGFWIKAGSAGSVTLAGEVPSGDSITINLVAGLNLVAYPWPMNVDLAKIQVTGQKGYDNDSYNPTTEIRVWAGNGYDTYGWTGSLLTDSPDLASEMGVTDDSLDNKWLNMDYEVPDEPINLGTGFWIKAQNAGTVTFSK